MFKHKSIKMQIIVIAHPGVGKTTLINNAIIPWCNENGFEFTFVDRDSGKTIRKLKTSRNKVCTIEELTPMQADLKGYTNAKSL